MRSYLQARGKVNKGIRSTLKEAPHRFLAYNNGITATAESVRLTTSETGQLALAEIRNLQIVNGGQTTASLHHSRIMDKTTLDGVSVQMKLTVVPPELLDEFVPPISRYANSQNKVNEADFSANDPYHVRLEELSRTVWAPAPEGTKEQTKWFYERARGQYADAKARERTPARKRQFTAQHPSRQKFSKTDLAKYLHSWDQLPHIVSRGAQKNFAEFSLRLAEKDSPEPDALSYHHIVAKALLFKTTERLVSLLKFGGYRANIVAYTIAYLVRHYHDRLDLNEFWKRQEIPDRVCDAILAVAPHVHESIIQPPQGRNVTEWCKKEECWAAIRKLRINLPASFKEVLASTPEVAEPPASAETTGSGNGSEQIIMEVQTVPAEVWFGLAKWAKETDNLQGWQRSLSFSLGKYVTNGWTPSEKQAIQGKKLFEQAKAAGFRPESAAGS